MDDKTLAEIKQHLSDRDNPGGTHYVGCHMIHIDCAANILA